MRAGVRRAAAALVTALALAAVAVPAAAAPGARGDDPTWAQVQAAKHDATKKATEVAAIQKALGGLEADAARLGTVALQRAADATGAERRLRAAEAVHDGLEAQAQAAGRSAQRARRTAASVATQMLRSGDPALTVWLSGTRSGSLLYRLGALAHIGDASSALLDHAVVEQRQSKALGDQAEAQAVVRDHLADVARSAANRVKGAEDAAERQVASTRARRATLQAQLKSLQARSASLASSYASAQEAKRAAAAAGRGGGGGGTLSGLGGGADSLSPAGAQAYAASRLGAHGWGGGQMGCLTRLWNIESGWRWNAYNASSGAYGIPQSLPGSKMAAAGGDWTTSAKTQIEWGLGYIQARYSTPCGALAFETSHVPYWY